MWENLKNHPEDKRYFHTLKEIIQQPMSWRKVAKLVLENDDLKVFLQNAISDKNKVILLSGAGSSEFVGKSILDTLSSLLDRRVISAATTDIVTHPKKFLVSGNPSLMISFARSGNSPESVAAVHLMKQVSASTKHLIITCNASGNLAQMQDTDTYSLILPEETNDQSLVMTSSFSSMVLSAVLCGYLYSNEKPYDLVEKTCMIVDPIFGDFSESLATMMKISNIKRIQYLGSSDAFGLLTEGHLKMLEMTDGYVATRVDSFLGLRHGPQVFIDQDTIVVAALSIDPYVRQYEIDMLKELKEKKQGLAYLVVGANPNEVSLPQLTFYDTGNNNDFFRLFPLLVIVQLLGLFKSLYLNLSPDAPSSSGTINRVVQGVTIYPYKD